MAKIVEGIEHGYIGSSDGKILIMSKFYFKFVPGIVLCVRVFFVLFVFVFNSSLFRVCLRLKRS